VKNLSQYNNAELHTGDITLSGDFTHVNGSFDIGAGKVTFASGHTQHLNLSAPTTFYDLEVSPGTVLVETQAADNASVIGELTNHGTISKTQAITSTGIKTFGLTGATLNITAQGSLSSLQVDQVGNNHPNANTQTMTGRYWLFTPTGGGYTADLTLPHVMAPDDVKLCRYTGSDWDCAVSAVTQTTLTRSGMTTLDNAVIGDFNRSMDLTLSMQATHQVHLDTPLIFTLAIGNKGSVSANGATLTHILPAGMTFDYATPSQGSCNEGTGTLTCNLGLVLGPAPAAGSAFDSSDEGWTANMGAQQSNWVQRGGYTGGFFWGMGSCTWYFVAPAVFTGNHADAYNYALTFYLRRTNTFNDSDADILLQGAGLTLTFSFNESYSPAATWTFYRIPLNETAGWKNQATEEPATQAEIQAVLGDITALWIRGSNNTSGGIAGLDTVILQHPSTPVSVIVQVTPPELGRFNSHAEVEANETDANPLDNSADVQVDVIVYFYLPAVMNNPGN
jgi:uncharacterized repeat protein (TIGR01451 family)